ncbi:MAG: ATP-binding protein [Bacteroidota bacterium]|nr:ATP-binding protein [Bacteroidota bacterium]
MQHKIFYGLYSWLEKRLFYQGCTDRQLQGNITVFENHTFFAIGSLLVYVIPLLIFAPQATIYIHYMIAFSCLYTLSVLLQLLFPRRHLVIHTCISSTMHLMTFYTVLQLGGIPTSGGLIFAGIANVLTTIPRQRAWLPISMFSIFSVWVVLLMILKPWLHVPEQMTPALNSVLFMVQAIVLTGAELAFVLRFIRHQRKLEELETQHLKEINEFKDRFFTNITHEFRTPLTVILGMADLIKKQPDQWTETGVEKIKSHGNNLLRLVNQMLNLAKAETGAISVHMVRRDINKYLAYLTEQFSAEALKKNIDLRFSSVDNPFEMDFDPEKLMYIITNLVYNALKFTPEGGRVDVITNTRNNGDWFAIQVRDTGIGIEKEHLDHLFDRFYKVENQLSPGSTGIGLALAKEITAVLQGSISVESIPGKGSKFTVLLPVTRNAPLSDFPDETELFKITDESYEKTGSSLEPPALHLSTEWSLPHEAACPAELPLLLIVEDSSDVVQYLQAILKNEYRTEVAVNGSIGLEKALEIIPDIILSDVMMPVMDGIELLEKLKKDIRTSHIPVVILTAKADIDSRLAGLERGADAYLAKPCNERELHIQLKNLIDLRKKLHDRYASLDHIPPTSDIYLKKEDDFMLKVKKVLESNLSDDEFGISQLCRELAVSHAQLYKKFKSLSNKTIADFFKTLRLLKAKELLLTTRLNITEITFAVGFKNLSYFSREFTREFGKSPSEFRKE